MEHDLILARYGEIGLKSRPVRRRFENLLKDNIEYAFATESLDVVVHRIPGRFLVHTSDLPKGVRILSRIFGLTSVSQARRTTAELVTLRAEAVRYALEWRAEHPEGRAFAIRPRRSGTHPYRSRDLAVELGAAVGKAGGPEPPLRVDLDRPDLALHVEVRDDKAYLFSEVVGGPGGLPLGSAGRVVVLLKDRNALVAAWLMMKRGATVIPVHFEGPTGRPEAARSFEAVLKAWYFRGSLHSLDHTEAARFPPEAACALCMRMMLRKAAEFAAGRRAKALVTGEVLGSTTAPMLALTAEASPLNVLRPILGLLPDVVAEVARRIGLADAGSSVGNEPCPLRTPARPDAETVRRLEGELGFAAAPPAVVEGTP